MNAIAADAGNPQPFSTLVRRPAGGNREPASTCPTCGQVVNPLV